VTLVIAPPRVVFDHLERLTDTTGLFEHAQGPVPRPEHGYCVDDVARALVVLCREPESTGTSRRLSRLYLSFVIDAVAPDGRCHNRMDTTGAWTDTPALGDWWGRALWSLGVAAGNAETPAMRARALAAFRVAAQRRGPSLHSMAFAALGAGELARVRPDEVCALDLLRDAGVLVGSGTRGHRWPWPEPRLRYGNGAVVEALLLAGETLPETDLLDKGLELLGFLLRRETRDGRLSVTPVAGRDATDDGVCFDQQPIEVASISDACATAYRLTLDPRWVDGVNLAWAWFLGENDSGTVMYDVTTGAGYDGLEAHGRNDNQGAESTLAYLSTAQNALRLRGLR
jgi:hypothetical protein